MTDKKKGADIIMFPIERARKGKGPRPQHPVNDNDPNVMLPETPAEVSHPLDEVHPNQVLEAAKKENLRSVVVLGVTPHGIVYQAASTRHPVMLQRLSRDFASSVQAQVMFESEKIICETGGAPDEKK